MLTDIKIVLTIRIRIINSVRIRNSEFEKKRFGILPEYVIIPKWTSLLYVKRKTIDSQNQK